MSPGGKTNVQKPTITKLNEQNTNFFLDVKVHLDNI